jgi:recombination DNA repair RAD52 pathway protein
MTERGITLEQFKILLSPIRPGRISSRKQGGKDLSYVEAWDIKAHLTRIFGFGNWDSEVLEYNHVDTRHYQTDQGKDMVEVVYNCRLGLTIRDTWGNLLCHHIEAAAGSASGPLSMLGDQHDNALKSAESDALKRCAINLGSQFGLSLYRDGSLAEVIKTTLVAPEGYEPPVITTEQTERLAQSLGTEKASLETGEREVR